MMAELTIENTVTLADRVEEYLYNYIIGNHLLPGDSLPSEKELSSMMGVSRNITRESLSRLKSNGHIVSRRRGGMMVSKVDTSREFSRILFPQLMDEMTIADILELRFLLEEAIAPILLDRITPKDIEELERMVEGDTMNAWQQSDVGFEMSFHSRIFEIAGNRVMTNLQEAFLPVYRYVCDHQEMFVDFNHHIGARATHRDIVEALKQGDLENYKSVVHRHLRAYVEYVKTLRVNV